MRTFDSSKTSTLPAAGTGKFSDYRLSHHGAVASPPGFAELGLSKHSKSFSTIRRKERVTENLRLTYTYLKKQIDGLAEIQGTLMLWINSKAREADQIGTQKVFMQPIENILNYSFRNVPLFGDGADDPMKLHFLKDGTRDIIEILVVPLLSQPSISSLRIAFAQDLIAPISLLESCGGEVINQRIHVDSKLQKVDELSKDLSNGCEEGVPLRANNSTSSNILLDFFRRAFGAYRSGSTRIRAKESYLTTNGPLAVDSKNVQL